ncbi:MAG TPA: carbon storage regulator CsrA [Pirellulaceae bacterium]|nr:carbon storage regulator CsrA [Pirellulaceae bacterium]HMO91386.1 carbon storage regulator CsrA [Pirellulaceae bacterium]HMP69611.1 carbon storage regulator CsrA [Pirellulaceae bacterium]
MLVLSRKCNESITIGDNIVIKVISTSGKKVRIGIEAPAHVRVLRNEVVESSHAEDSQSELAMLHDEAQLLLDSHDLINSAKYTNRSVLLRRLVANAG